MWPPLESPFFRFILALLTISPRISQLLSLPAHLFTSDGVLEPISRFVFFPLYFLRFCLVFQKPVSIVISFGSLLLLHSSSSSSSSHHWRRRGARARARDMGQERRKYV